MTTLKREEIGGGYSGTKKIIIDVCEIDGEFEVIALYEDGEELDCKNVATESEALKAFDELFEKYAGELQKAVYGKLEQGKKYTLVYLNDFGFPTTQKITFHISKCTTYAQFGDCVDMVFKPYRKQKMYHKRFYNCSFMIFEGWQDLKESDTSDILKDDKNVKITKSKYGCFDARYMDDLKNIFKNPVVIYKDYKKGVNGKMYA